MKKILENRFLVLFLAVVLLYAYVIQNEVEQNRFIPFYICNEERAVGSVELKNTYITILRQENLAFKETSTVQAEDNSTTYTVLVKKKDAAEAKIIPLIVGEANNKK